MRLGIALSIAAVSSLHAGCSGRLVRDDEGALPAPSAENAQIPGETGTATSAAEGTVIEKSVHAQSSPGASGGSAEYHFSMAQAYVAEGNPDRAIEEYKLALIYDPNSPLIYTRLATEYVKKGSLSAAMEMCKEALQREPKHLDARLLLAGLYSTTHENDEALLQYDTILKSNPSHEEAIVYRSQLLLETGRTAEALQPLKAYLKKNEESALAWYSLGRVHQQQNQPKEAVNAYRRAMEVRSGFTQAGLSLGFLFEEQGKNTQAIDVYKRLYEESQDQGAANRLATLYLKTEKYKEAVPYLEALQAADPEDLNVRVKLGLVQMELKDYDRAIATFKEILARNPDSDRIHYYLGSIYEEQKKFEEAIAELKLIQPTSKLFGDSVLHVAYLLKELKRVGDAKEFLAKAIQLEPKIPGLYLFHASLEEETQNVANATAIVQRGLAHFPEDEKLRYYLGSLFDRAGNTDKSLEQMEILLSINPKNVDALNYIGYTWTVSGVRLNDAEQMLRKALALKPNNGYVKDSWGWHLFVRGRVNEAIIELEKAAKLKPNEATILEHLADAYVRANVREKAYHQYVEAIRHAADDETRRKIESKLETLKTELAKSGRGVPTGESNRLPASSPSPSARD